MLAYIYLLYSHKGNTLPKTIITPENRYETHMNTNLASSHFSMTIRRLSRIYIYTLSDFVPVLLASRSIYHKASTLPETNIAPENRSKPKRKGSSSSPINFQVRTCSFKGGIVITRQVSHEQIPLTFCYTGCLIKILTMVYYKPPISG